MVTMIKTSVLLPAAAIFVGLISLSINASKQQITDTAKTLSDKDDSNSMNEEQNIEMSIKNRMEIQTQDQSYIVIINGQKVTEFTGDRFTEGYVGLQAHDDKSKVSFRNIIIKEIR
jgi:hypothetical protein